MHASSRTANSLLEVFFKLKVKVSRFQPELCIVATQQELLQYACRSVLCWSLCLLGVQKLMGLEAIAHYRALGVSQELVLPIFAVIHA